MGKPVYIRFRMFGAGCCGSCLAHPHPLTLEEAKEYDRELKEMEDKDKVKKYLKNVVGLPKTSDYPDENECDQCTMSETMHRKYPKNTCGDFTKVGLNSHDGEARKDGWDEK